MRKHGLTHSEVPIALASGEMSKDFIDGKAALARGRDLRLACEAMIDAIDQRGVEFDAVGGLTMGADQFAHVIAVLYDKEWFVVRKERKGRGTNKLVEAAELGPTTRVLLVDDVVTTGGSIQQAYHAVVETGAQIAAAATLVDRGERASEFFEAHDIPYVSVVTYNDLDIDPVGAAGDFVSA